MKRGLRQFLKRGVVAVVGFLTSGASPVSAASVTTEFGAPYQIDVKSGGSAGNEVVNLPLVGDFIGQRLLVTFLAEGNAADVVRINAAATGQIVQEAFTITGVAAYAQAVVTNVDLDTPGEYALFEFTGTATPTWNIVYTTGALS